MTTTRNRINDIVEAYHDDLTGNQMIALADTIERLVLERAGQCVSEPRPDPKWNGPKEHAPMVVYCITHGKYGGCDPVSAAQG